MTKGRREILVSFGDNNFSGLGIIKCNACGKPLRDHLEIKPCPALGRDTIHVSHSRRRSDTPDAIKKRKQRERKVQS